MGILYARGVDDRILEKLKKEAEECGYLSLGSFINTLFAILLEEEKKDE